MVNVTTTSRSGPVSEAVLDNPRVATLSFTASTYVGKLLLSRTASGGSAWTAAPRFCVHESFAEEFTARFQAALASMRIGPGIDQSNDLGAMVSVKERDKIPGLVDQAESEGGPATTVSKAPDSVAFLAPRIVRNVEPGFVLTREEIFGPVAPIVTVTSTEEALSMANDTYYGLISYAFARDDGEGLRVGRQLGSGMVAINRGVVSDPAAPFGGRKESGVGREGGFAGIYESLESQYLAVDLG